MTDVKSNEDLRLQEHVNHIAECINNSDWANGATGEDALNVDGYPMDAIDYLQDVLDIEWILSSDKQTLLGARLLVAFGGPNIWINTRSNKVEGYWWGGSATASFDSNLELDDALETIFHC